MNVRHAFFVFVVVTAFGQVGSAACGGKVGATGVSAGSANDAGAIGAPSASSTGSSGSGSSSGAGPSDSSSSSSGSVGSSSSSDAAPETDSGSGNGPGNGSESGALDSSPGGIAGDGSDGMDADGALVDGGEASVSDGGCSSAAVSFSADVIPVFRYSCTLSQVCHGQMNNAQEESLYLGLNQGGTDPNTVYMQLVGVKARELPAMNLVTASDLAGSFLWRKIQTQSDLNALGSQCMMAAQPCSDCNAATPCGTTMPYLGAPIDPGFACTIQNWIQSGAKND